MQVSHLTQTVAHESGPLTILQDVSFNIQSAESIAITGASGSGKSTLLGLVAGLDRPTSGEVAINGEEIFSLDEDQRAAQRGRCMGFVFRLFKLLPCLPAMEKVMLPMELLGLENARERAAAILQRVGLSARLQHYPKQLSGGEQQRVAIARAFVTEPALLLADEPTGNLDSATGATVIDLLFNLNQERGTTLLLVTHDSALAQRCRRTLSLSAGRLMDAAA